MCVQWTRVLYSAVITRQSNPPISQFNSPCNEFTSFWSMFVYNTHPSPQYVFCFDLISGMFFNSLKPITITCFNPTSRITSSRTNHSVSLKYFSVSPLVACKHAVVLEESFRYTLTQITHILHSLLFTIGHMYR